MILSSIFKRKRKRRYIIQASPASGKSHFVKLNEGKYFGFKLFDADVIKYYPELKGVAREEWLNKLEAPEKSILFCGKIAPSESFYTVAVYIADDIFEERSFSRQDRAERGEVNCEPQRLKFHNAEHFKTKRNKFRRHVIRNNIPCFSDFDKAVLHVKSIEDGLKKEFSREISHHDGSLKIY